MTCSLEIRVQMPFRPLQLGESQLSAAHVPLAWLLVAFAGVRSCLCHLVVFLAALGNLLQDRDLEGTIVQSPEQRQIILN